MTLNLVTGPFHPDLEEAFAEAVRGGKDADALAPLAVVASSQRLADRLKEVAVRACPKGLVGVHFFNLHSFARFVLERREPLGGTRLADPLLLEKLLLELIEKHFAEAPYLARAARGARTPRALLGAMNDLRDACVDPAAVLRLFVEEIEEALSGGEGKTVAESESPRVAEVLALYARFEEERNRRGWRDRHDVAALAVRGDLDLPFAHVFYYGFYELVQAQIDLLRAVAGRTAVTVFYPFVDAPAYSFARGFLTEVLRPLARDERVLPPSLRPSSLAVRAYTASGFRDEVWIAAKEIVRWRDRGLRRIGVVARSLDPYVDPIESIFPAHGIPFQSNAERPPRQDAYLRAARQLFTLHERDYSREEVLDFLSSPAVRKSAGAGPIVWDRITRDRGIGHGIADWRDRLAGPEAAELREVLERLFRLGPPPEGNWSAAGRWAVDALENLLGPVPDDLAARLALLEELEDVRPRPRSGEIGETLLGIVEGMRRPIGGNAGVQVLDAMAARGTPFDALVVLGLNERFFPRYILQDPFLRDEVRSRIEHRLGNRLPLKTRGYEEERLLFALLLSSSEETVLVRRRSDEKGRVQVPSIFLSEMELAEVPVPRSPKEKLDLAVPLTPREASVRAHFAHGAAAEIAPLARAYGWSQGRLERAREFLRRTGVMGRPGPFDGYIGKRTDCFPARGISPTALERLALCPFQYFARQVLGLEPLEEPEARAGADVTELGTLYHRAIYFHHTRSLPLREAVERAWSELAEKRSLRYPVLAEAMKDRMTETLQAFLDEDERERAGFVPAEFELPLQGEIEGVPFQGVVDRIDLFDEGRAFRVIDYKRSRSDKFASKMETGVLEKGSYLQPPIYYLLAAMRYPGADPARSSSGYSFFEGGSPPMVLSGAFLARREEFGSLLRAHLDRIREGRFGIRVGNHCGYCDYAAVCRKSHMPTRLRVEREESRAT